MKTTVDYKSIGFRRNIYLEWMDAAAAFCAEIQDVDQLRMRLDPIVAEQVKSQENRAVALKILTNIWYTSVEKYPDLQPEAVRLYTQSITQSDRLWLHYGMTLLTYDFFRLGVSIIGQLSRYSDVLTPKEVKQKMMAEMGELGAIEKATERIIFSLRNWGVLVDSEERYAYKPLRRHFTASNLLLEEWLLRVALTVHPAQEIPFADLLRLPELFPFQFSIGVDQLRQSQWFAVQRQGISWDMVRLAD
jgi:hypothetical protein